MTENEAMKNLETLERFYRIAKSGSALHEVLINFVTLEDLVVAIQALEEIQEYRAIGTVEQLEWCKDASHWKELFKEKLEKYEAIGTIEEFKALKEKEERFDRNIKMYNEIGLEIRAKAIDDFAHQFKENLNQEFPSNYESTRPYFSLENARLIVDDVAEQMKAGGIDG